MNDRSDADLLRGFSGSGSTADFESLVRRHGRMVHAVSMRVLSNHHDAQDVTQAVFLTLAREAAHLAGKPSVAGWLHTVARRLSLDVRRSRESRQRREQAMMEESQHPGTDADLTRRFQGELDLAIGRLPDRYRQPLVLCYLEGASQAEVARRLDLEPSTLRTRLSRACDMLRRLLVSRGVEITSVGVLTTLLAAEAEAASAAFTPALLSAALKTGIDGGASCSPGVLKLSGKAAGAKSAAVSSSFATLMILMKGKATLIAAGLLVLLAAGISASMIRQSGWNAPGAAAELHRGATDDPRMTQAEPSGGKSAPRTVKSQSVDEAERALLAFDLSPVFKGTSEEESTRCVLRLRSLVADIPAAYYSELATRLGKGADRSFKRTALFRAIYQEWGRIDLAAALADLSRIDDERTLQQTLESLLLGAADNDRNAAMKVAETIRFESVEFDDRARSSLMDTLFDEWIQSDPFSALQWARQAKVPDQRREQWITDGLRAWSKQDPDAAAKWREQEADQEPAPQGTPR